MFRVQKISKAAASRKVSYYWVSYCQVLVLALFKNILGIPYLHYVILVSIIRYEYDCFCYYRLKIVIVDNDCFVETNCKISTK